MREKYKEDRFLRAGHFAGLKFDEGWLFIQVVGTEYVEMKPYILQNENEVRGEIAAQTAGVKEEEVIDEFDSNVLEPDSDERNTINQILFGVAPSRMQVFTLFGRDRNVALQDYDEPEDPAAFVNGFDSPYNNPSPQTEIFYTESQAPLRFQAFNPTDTPLEARLSFHVNKLRYTVVTDKGLMKAMLQGQQPASFHMMGLGVQNRDQSGVPSWMTEAFGEHIYTTSEILNSNGGSGSSLVDESAASLESRTPGSNR